MIARSRRLFRDLLSTVTLSSTSYEPASFSPDRACRRNASPRLSGKHLPPIAANPFRQGTLSGGE